MKRISGRMAGILIALAATFGMTSSPASAESISYLKCNSGSFYFYGYTGRCIVGTNIAWTAHSDGTERAFLVGTDHAIWNIVRYRTGGVSGWKSLGGWGKTGAYTRNVIGSYNLTVATIGSDSRYWCRHLSSGGWGSWYRC